MPEIAYTAFGRNALVAGLIGHGAAILVAMMPASGTELFFKIVFLVSCHLLFVGAYRELKNRGIQPLRNWRFYVIATVAFIPLMGPFIVMALLYRTPGNAQEGRIGVSGLFSAILRLRANALVIFVLIIALVLLFAVIQSRHDPYFKRGQNPPQPVFSVDRRGNFRIELRGCRVRQTLIPDRIQV